LTEDLVRNRKALHTYHVEQTWEAGIALQGTEVKSLRLGLGQLQDAYVDAQDGELWLRQANISPFDKGSWTNHDPLRARKLLLHRSEIDKIVKAVQRKGYTVIPLAIYLNDKGIIKLRIALALGKNTASKKEALKERDAKREMDRVRKGDRD
jgi:SsrA-binding protein